MKIPRLHVYIEPASPKVTFTKVDNRKIAKLLNCFQNSMVI